MRLSTSLVAVKKIVSSIPLSDFDGGQIEQLAQQILKAEGIVNPLILRRESLESYEVVDGYFEYYAAVRARELDPRKGEMISAYIIESENDDVRSAIEAQKKLLRESGSTDPIIDSDQATEISKSILAKLNSFEYRINTFEKSLQEKIEGIKKVDYTKLSSDEIDAIGNKIGDKLAAVIQESLEKTKPESQPSKKSKYDKEKSEMVLQILNNFDESQIKLKLSEAKIFGKTANKLAQNIYQGRLSESYHSIEDAMEKIERLGEKTMQKIIEKW